MWICSGQKFQVLCPLHNHIGGTVVRPEDDGFKDRLCDAIGQSVRSIDIGDDAVVVTLDRCRIELLYGRYGAEGETLNFTNRDHAFRVFAKMSTKPA